MKLTLFLVIFFQNITKKIVFLDMKKRRYNRNIFSTSTNKEQRKKAEVTYLAINIT